MKRMLLVVEPLLLVGAALAFEPWTAFTSSTVNEADPLVSAPAATGEPTEVAPPEIARGEFVSQEHGTSGVARILLGPDGSLALRLEASRRATDPICTCGCLIARPAGAGSSTTRVNA